MNPSARRTIRLACFPAVLLAGCVGSRGSFEGVVETDGRASSFAVGLVDVVGPRKLEFVSSELAGDVGLDIRLVGDVAPSTFPFSTALLAPAHGALTWRDADDGRIAYDVDDGSLTIDVLPTPEDPRCEGSFTLRLEGKVPRPTLRVTASFHVKMDGATARYYRGE